ncbi:hypothetical protein PFISCL1PPCAC_18594, partial [Pristionchus fissidentatus]
SNIWFRRELDDVIAYKAMHGRRHLAAFAIDSSTSRDQFHSYSNDGLFSALSYACNAMGEELNEVLDEEAHKMDPDM